MIVLLSAVGWGLFTVGAVTHAIHWDRLVHLLRGHVGRPVRLARLLVGLEAALAVTLPVTYLAGIGSAVIAAAVVAGLVAAGFTIFVMRLLLHGSELPCACSFSAGPTTGWSLMRSAATLTAALIAFAPEPDGSSTVATLLVGAALGAVIFVLPDALSWPGYAKSMQAIATSAAGRTLPVPVPEPVRRRP